MGGLGREGNECARDGGDAAEDHEVARGGQGVPTGEPRVPAEHRLRETVDGRSSVANPARSGRGRGEGDGGGKVGGRGDREGGKDASERIGGGAVRGVIELGIAADGEKIGAEGELDRPLPEVGIGREGVVRECRECGVGIVGGELGRDGRGEFGRDAAEQGHVAPVAAEAELDLNTPGVGLVNGGQCLIHVLRAAVVVGGNTEGDEHGGSIPEACRRPESRFLQSLAHGKAVYEGPPCGSLADGPV